MEGRGIAEVGGDLVCPMVGFSVGVAWKSTVTEMGMGNGEAFLVPNGVGYGIGIGVCPIVNGGVEIKSGPKEDG